MEEKTKQLTNDPRLCRTHTDPINIYLPKEVETVEVETVHGQKWKVKVPLQQQVFSDEKNSSNRQS